MKRKPQPRKRPKKVYVSIRLPVPMVDKIDTEARLKGVGRSEMIRIKLDA